EPEFMTREAARMSFGLVGPFLDRCLVEHVTWSRMVVDANSFAELASEQRGCRDVEDFAGQIPQRHLDRADGASTCVCGPICSRSAQISSPLAHERVQSIDLERIFS